MSLHNDIDWSNWKRNEDICESNADLGATCVEQFRPVRGTSVDIQECGTYMYRNRCGSGTILATRRAYVSSETLHHNNVVVVPQNTKV